MLATLNLKKLQLYAFHGTEEIERELGQIYELDLSVVYDVPPSRIASPDEQPRIDPARVYDAVQQIVLGTKFKALEGLGLSIARKIFKVYEEAQVVCIAVRKQRVAIPGIVGSIEIELTVAREDLEEI